MIYVMISIESCSCHVWKFWSGQKIRKHKYHKYSQVFYNFQPAVLHLMAFCHFAPCSQAMRPCSAPILKGACSPVIMSYHELP